VFSDAETCWFDLDHTGPYADRPDLLHSQDHLNVASGPLFLDQMLQFWDQSALQETGL
jgi:hypothetical protein